MYLKRTLIEIETNFYPNEDKLVLAIHSTKEHAR